MFVKVVAVMAVFPKRHKPATATELSVPVVMLTAGLPEVPVEVFVTPRGDVWSTPVKEPQATLIPSVAPVTVTASVCEPVAGAIKYHISPAIFTDRVEGMA